MALLGAVMGAGWGGLRYVGGQTGALVELEVPTTHIKGDATLHALFKKLEPHGTVAPADYREAVRMADQLLQKAASLAASKGVSEEDYLVSVPLFEAATGYLVNCRNAARGAQAGHIKIIIEPIAKHLKAVLVQIFHLTAPCRTY